MSAWAVLVVALMLAFDLERPLPALELTSVLELPPLVSPPTAIGTATGPARILQAELAPSERQMFAHARLVSRRDSADELEAVACGKAALPATTKEAAPLAAAGGASLGASSSCSHAVVGEEAVIVNV